MKPTIKIFISSPGDTTEERQMVKDVINEWNKSNSETHNVSNRYDVILIPTLWEDLPPETKANSTPQDNITEAILDSSDMLIGIFKIKLGTPTKNYPSGTVEEIERSIKKGNLFFYIFSKAE